LAAALSRVRGASLTISRVLAMAVATIFAPSLLHLAAPDEQPVGQGDHVQDAEDNEDLADSDLRDTFTLVELLGGFEDPAAQSTADDMDVSDAWAATPSSSSTAPPGGSGAEVRVEGSVERFSSQRGYGVIRPDGGGQSVFAHWTQITSGDQWPVLIAGMRVEFCLRCDAGKWLATRITLPGGGAIDPPEDMRSARTLSDFFVAGTVARFNHAGFGFIKIDASVEWPEPVPEGEELYVSREDLVMAEGSQSFLEKGMRVRFRVYKPPGKPTAAAEVTDIEGGPIVYRPATTAPARKEETSVGAAAAESTIAGARRVQKTILKDCVPYLRPKLKPKVSAASDVLMEEKNAEQLQQPAYDSSNTQVGIGQQMLHGTAGLLLRSAPAHALKRLQAIVGASVDALGAHPSCSGVLSARQYQAGLAGLTTEQEAASEAAQQCGALVDLSDLQEDPFTSQVLDLLSEAHAKIYLESTQGGYQAGRTGVLACKFFLEGRCSKGTDCRFAHEASGASASAAQANVACKFFAEGRCAKGSACPYAHAASSGGAVEAAHAQTPCRFFALGSCKRGTECFYAHTSQASRTKA